MSASRQRSVWIQAAILAVAFFGGGAAGVGLSGRLAPDSAIAQFVGLFTFPMPFVVGMQLWLGVALITAVWRLLRGRSLAAAAAIRAGVPPGSIVFLPISVALVGFAGLLIGILGSPLGLLATVGLYLLLGGFFGTACWLLARSGYLPFPRE
jgi:hypothetical protein